MQWLKQEIETQTAIINAERVELARANRDAQQATENLNNELDKEQNKATKATDELANKIGEVGEVVKGGATELSAALDKAANTNIGLTLNNPEAIANVLNGEKIGQKITASVKPVVEQAILDVIGGISIGPGGQIQFRSTRSEFP